MKNYNKTFFGSVIAFILGTSCCWLSSIIIWLGGSALVASIASQVIGLQIVLISLGVILLIVTLVVYLAKE